MNRSCVGACVMAEAVGMTAAAGGGQPALPLAIVAAAALGGVMGAAPEARPVPWPKSQRTLYLRLTPDEVTGRRLLEA